MAAAPDHRGLVLRPVERSDADVLFRWLNEPDRRATSFRTSGPVAWIDHVAWLDRHLDDANGWHALALMDGKPAGQVRIEREDGSAVVSLYVDQAFRGCGVGQRLIEAACREAGRRWPGLPVLAHVRADNPASLAFFQHSGFSLERPLADRAILRRVP